MKFIVNPSLSNWKYILPFYIFSLILGIMSSLIISPNNRKWILTGILILAQFICFLCVLVYPNSKFSIFFFNFINFIFISSYLYTIYFQSIEQLVEKSGGIKDLGIQGSILFILGIIFTFALKFIINKTSEKPVLVNE